MTTTHNGARYGPVCNDFTPPPSCDVLQVVYNPSLGTRATPGFHMTVTASGSAIQEIYFLIQFTSELTDISVSFC